MKKYLSLALAVILTLSLTVTVLAKTQYYDMEDYPVKKTVLDEENLTLKIKYIDTMINYCTDKGKCKKCPKLNVYGYNKKGKWELLKTAKNDGCVKVSVKNLAKDGKVGKKKYKNTYVVKIIGADDKGKDIGLGYYIYVKN